MKKTSMILTGLLMISSIGFAAPMTDFSLGKVQLDAMKYPSLNMDIRGQNGGEYATDSTPSAKNNFDYGITAGLGSNFALQYKNNKADAYYDYNSDASYCKMREKELNVLYKVDKSSAVFIGMTRSKLDLVDNVYGNNYSGTTTKGYQVGLQTTVPISEKINGYAVASVGTKVTSFELGLAYKISNNIDFNMSYLNSKYKDLVNEYSTEKADYAAAGVGAGVSYRF
ncbi:MAG: hypothetical protein H6Q74_2044 [Firmicutes bacterium]|nr:hypothetical protein [Bacillota bacterium]